MKIEHNGLEENFAPKTIWVLRNLEGIHLYHTEKGCRHPLEIYSTTFKDVLEKTVFLLEYLNELATILPHIGNNDQDWSKRLANLAYNWLGSIIQHIDSCKGVLACFFSNQEEKQKDKCIKQFSARIEEYRKEVATIVNLIKHNQRFLRIIYFHWVGGFVPGYYIEGIVEDGLVGPEPRVHKNSNAAISFIRNLPEHFCNLFSVSNVLAQSIYEITKRKPLMDSKTVYRSEDLSKALKLLSLSQLIFFPDEVIKPVPFVRCHSEIGRNSVKILLEMPSNRGKPTTIPIGSRVTVLTYIDEVSHEFKIPYL